jgi:hypothetical protein
VSFLQVIIFSIIQTPLYQLLIYKFGTKKKGAAETAPLKLNKQKPT